MVNVGSSDRSQALSAPPGLRAGVPEDDPVHFIMEAVERLPIDRFKVDGKGTGKAPYHPHRILAVLIHHSTGGAV